MFLSFKHNRIGILLMILSSVCACFGQFFWKISDASFFYLVSGFFLYGIGALVMIIAYRFGSLSVLQPMLSFSYILSTVIAALFLKEHVSFYKYSGVFFIICGVGCIALGDDKL